MSAFSVLMTISLAQEIDFDSLHFFPVRKSTKTRHPEMAARKRSGSEVSLGGKIVFWRENCVLAGKLLVGWIRLEG
jgi:hypothetical protein